MNKILFKPTTWYILILFKYCMQYGDKGLLSIILAGRGILVKMLITLELHGIF